MTIHNPQNPRHARIFDLLRHGDPSVETTDEDRTHASDPRNVEHQDAVKEAALRSFAPSGVSAVAFKPGRNYKLF